MKNERTATGRPARGTWAVISDVGMVGDKRRRIRRRGFKTTTEAAGMLREIQEQRLVDGVSVLRAVVESKRDEINDLERQRHGRTAALFGSVARGDDTPERDMDLLVEFEPGSSLFDLMDLQEALESLLEVSVEVVSVGGLKDRDEHIRREAVPT